MRLPAQHVGVDSMHACGAPACTPACKLLFYACMKLTGLQACMHGVGRSVRVHACMHAWNRRICKQEPADLHAQDPSSPLATQEEIDRLTRRAKAGEAAFLDVYQALADAPDPAPALAAGADAEARAAEALAVARRTRHELARARRDADAAGLQDTRVRRLEENVRVLEAELRDKDADLKKVGVRGTHEGERARAGDGAAK
eukprot:306665-Chlamydomonas_euryale.AAC.2